MTDELLLQSGHLYLVVAGGVTDEQLPKFVKQVRIAAPDEVLSDAVRLRRQDLLARFTAGLGGLLLGAAEIDRDLGAGFALELSAQILHGLVRQHDGEHAVLHAVGGKDFGETRRDHRCAPGRAGCADP